VHFQKKEKRRNKHKHELQISIEHSFSDSNLAGDDLEQHSKVSHERIARIDECRRLVVFEKEMANPSEA
jgi:hypothetical protein